MFYNLRNISTKSENQTKIKKRDRCHKQTFWQRMVFISYEKQS